MSFLPAGDLLPFLNLQTVFCVFNAASSTLLPARFSSAMAVSHLTLGTMSGVLWKGSDHLLALLSLVGVVVYYNNAPESWVCSVSASHSAQDICLDTVTQSGSMDCAILDWSAFQSRAAAADHMNWVEPKDGCMLCFAILSARLRSCCLTADLLPNLRSLECHCSSVRGLQGIREWMPRTLRVLRVTVGPRIRHVLTLLTAIRRCEAIEQLELRRTSRVYESGQARIMSLSMAALCKNRASIQKIVLPVELVNHKILDVFSIHLGSPACDCGDTSCAGAAAAGLIRLFRNVRFETEK
jgi:hypothetical protein